MACGAAAPHAMTSRLIPPFCQSRRGQFYCLAGPGPGFVGDPEGTVGLAFGVFGGKGFDEGGVGISGAEFGTDGDVGGGGVCCVQPITPAPSTRAARVNLASFMVASSNRRLISLR